MLGKHSIAIRNEEFMFCFMRKTNILKVHYVVDTRLAIDLSIFILLNEINILILKMEKIG